VPDRDDHYTVRLVGTAILMAVLSPPALSQVEDRPSAGRERWSQSDVVKAYADYRRPPADSVRLPRLPAVAADPFLLMLHKSLSRKVNDLESMQVFGSLSTTSVGPGDEIDVVRRCRASVRDRLKELHLPFDIDRGRAINLGNLNLGDAGSGLLNPSTDDDILLSDTAPTAVSKAAERKRRDQWKVSFGLTYQGIPLEKSASVVSLASGDSLTIDWRNLPRLDQIPPDSELKANVSRHEALTTGLDLFRQTVEKHGDQALAQKLKFEPSTPSLNLWFPARGIGRLAWTFLVTVGTDEVADLGSFDFCIEARKPVQDAKPRIFTHFSTPILQALGTQTTGIADSVASSPLSYSK